MNNEEFLKIIRGTRAQKFMEEHKETVITFAATVLSDLMGQDSSKLSFEEFNIKVSKIAAAMVAFYLINTEQVVEPKHNENAN